MEPGLDDKKKVIKVKVNDKRRVGQEPAGEAVATAPSSGPVEMSETGSVPSREVGRDDGVSGIPAKGLPDDAVARSTEADDASATGRDYLDDLKRLQADFDNYRKRMMRDQAAVGERASARVIENLLPVLDNFERAIAHGEGGEGVQMVFKDLKAALEREGLEEVPGEGVEFDPNVHDAVESRPVEGLEGSTVIEVYRRGYLHKGQLLRAAMVVVGRPPERDEGTASTTED